MQEILAGDSIFFPSWSYLFVLFYLDFISNIYYIKTFCYWNRSYDVTTSILAPPPVVIPVNGLHSLQPCLKHPRMRSRLFTFRSMRTTCQSWLVIFSDVFNPIVAPCSSSACNFCIFQNSCISSSSLIININHISTSYLTFILVLTSLQALFDIND